MVTTPNAVSTYQRYMARLWDDRDGISVATGFQSIFGRPSTGAETLFSLDAEVVDMDVQRGNEKAAVLVPRGGIDRSLDGIQALNEEKYSSFSRVYPLSIEMFDIASGQLNKRGAGEQPYASWSREKRLRKLSIKAMKETVRRTVRMFERLASQSARTGKQDAILGETVPQFDWKRNAANTITVGTKWDAATPDIVGDMDDGADVIRQNGHTRPQAMIVGTSAMKALIKDSDVQTLSDNRRYEFVKMGRGTVLPSKLAFLSTAGFDARGYIVTYGGREIWLFTYQEGYTNSGGTFTPYMPVDEALMFSVDARCDRYFGPPETLPLDSAMRAFYQDRFGMSPNAIPSVPILKNGGTIMPEMFFFDAYPNGTNTTITHRTQSAPIFGTTHVDAFARLIGLV